jgi:hypothetical protein
LASKRRAPTEKEVIGVTLERSKGPSATWGRTGPRARPWRRPRLYFSTQTVAIQVYRPTLRRWVTVAKFVDVGGEPVLGIPYRHRRRLQEQVSLPLVVVRYAQEHGAAAIVIRLDDEHTAYRLSLEEALRLGQREWLDGQVEVWLDLVLFDECPWPDWPFAVQVVRLGPGPGELPRQLSLGEEVRT